MMNLGVDITKEEIDDLVHLADLDGDGTIDKSGKAIISDFDKFFSELCVQMYPAPTPLFSGMAGFYMTFHGLACFWTAMSC